MIKGCDKISHLGLSVCDIIVIFMAVMRRDSVMECITHIKPRMLLFSMDFDLSSPFRISVAKESPFHVIMLA